MPKKPEQPEQKTCFVIGPIGAEDSPERLEADWLLEMIIEPVMEAHPDFKVERADKITIPGRIDAQVINTLLSAELVIADLTGFNPNAFYEIGIRHMVQKPIIHMIAEGTKLPFDVNPQRTIFFGRARPAQIKKARGELAAHVNAVLAPDFQVDNPVTAARGRFELEQRATPDEKLLIAELQTIKSRLSALETGGTFILANPPFAARKSQSSDSFWTVEVTLRPDIGLTRRLSATSELAARLEPSVRFVADEASVQALLPKSEWPEQKLQNVLERIILWKEIEAVRKDGHLFPF